MKKRLFTIAREACIIGFVSFILLEITLRIFPSVIPPKLLFLFEPGLRSELANGRFLTKKDRTPVVRDDQGPALSIWKPHSKIHYNFTDPAVTNDVTVDETGFCNPEGACSQSTVDIVTIGDSFTFCFTVPPDETWTKRLSDYTGLRSCNLGLIGVGMYEYIQLLKTYGLPKSPKIVIMNVYEGNDLQNAVDYWNHRNAKKEKPEEKPVFVRVYNYLTGSWLGKHSYTLNLFVSSATWGFIKMKSGEENSEDYQYTLQFPKGTVPFNLENTELDEMACAKQFAAGSLDFEPFAEGLEQFVVLAERHHFKPVVAYSPSPHTAYRDFVAFADSSMQAMLNSFSRQQRAFFEKKAQELGYQFVDLTPALSQAAPQHDQPGNLLYFQTSLHLTGFGHETIARKLAGELDSLSVTVPESLPSE